MNIWILLLLCAFGWVAGFILWWMVCIAASVADDATENALMASDKWEACIKAQKVNDDDK